VGTLAVVFKSHGEYSAQIHDICLVNGRLCITNTGLLGRNVVLRNEQRGRLDIHRPSTDYRCRYSRIFRTRCCHNMLFRRYSDEPMFYMPIWNTVRRKSVIYCGILVLHNTLMDRCFKSPGDGFTSEHRKQERCTIGRAELNPATP
jgi:hypothetical protein